MKCSLCDLPLGLCDHPVFEYRTVHGKQKKFWLHDCCKKHKFPCRSLVQHLIKHNLELPHEDT